jgi:hypothetical protein
MNTLKWPLLASLFFVLTAPLVHAQPACSPDQPYQISSNYPGTVRSFSQNIYLDQTSPTVGGSGWCWLPRGGFAITAYASFTNVNCSVVSGQGNVVFNGSPHQIDTFLTAYTPHGTQVLSAEFYADCRCYPNGELWYNNQDIYDCY